MPALLLLRVFRGGKAGKNRAEKNPIYSRPCDAIKTFAVSFLRSVHSMVG